MSKWLIVILDDGRPWLTDGTFGIDPEGVPDLLEAARDALEELRGEDMSYPVYNALRLAIAKAQGVQADA